MAPEIHRNGAADLAQGIEIQKPLAGGRKEAVKQQKVGALSRMDRISQLCCQGDLVRNRLARMLTHHPWQGPGGRCRT